MAMERRHFKQNNHYQWALTSHWSELRKETWDILIQWITDWSRDNLSFGGMISLVIISWKAIILKVKTCFDIQYVFEMKKRTTVYSHKVKGVNSGTKWFTWIANDVQQYKLFLSKTHNSFNDRKKRNLKTVDKIVYMYIGHSGTFLSLQVLYFRVSRLCVCLGGKMYM